MNIGKNILELRKAKNVTQDALAAELGVTAAAVSKWENGYTLPDILMLCALADYFEVTTDELLGRNAKTMVAVIAAETPDLGEAIKTLVKQYGIVTRRIVHSYPEAVDAVNSDLSVTHLFVSLDKPLNEEQYRETRDNIRQIESRAPELQKTLDGFEIYLKHMPVYDELCERKHLT
ncbi:MAG: helix-turn-helix domain-containing protein [Oscillospiraceae bacterium]|nr:helix-turn-helix domain-containing protein [Oscillospiraceae bacterium]